MTTYNVDIRVTGTISSDGAVIDPPPGGGVIGPPPDTTPPPDPGTPPSQGQATIQVGPTRYVTEPADALTYLASGGTIILDDGIYKKSFHHSNPGLTLKSASGNPFKCYFDGQGGVGGGHRLAWGKGMVHADVSTNFYGVGFRNCGSPQSGDNYSNEAAIWVGDTNGTVPVSVHVERCSFDNNANGCFTAGEHNIMFTIKDSIYGYISANGKNAAAGAGGGHPAHDNYLQTGEVDVSGCYFYGCCAGHNVKSRAAKTTVHDNPCMTQDGGRVLDAPEGGVVSFTNNTVHTRKDRTSQPPAGCYGNSNMIEYAGENQNQGIPGMHMSGNTLHVSRINSTIWANAGSKITADADVVKYYEDGSLVLNGNVVGISGGSAPPGSISAPSLPTPPSWAAMSWATVEERDKS